MRLLESLEDRRLLAGEPTPDLSFGSGGGVQFDFDTSGSYAVNAASAVAAGPSGSLYVVGDARNNANTAGLVELAKLRADGTLDTTFGGGDGVATFSVPGTGPSSFKGVAVQSDGKILAVGQDQFVLGQMLVVRFNTDGTLDTSFDGDGYRTYGNSGPDTAYVAKQLTGGKILIGGSYEDFNRSDMGVLRLNANGSPDTTFSGGDGAANFDFYGGNDFLYDIAPLTDGSVVGVGSTFVSGRSGLGPAIVKYTPSGALDTTFAEFGASDFYTRLGVGSFYAVETLPSGKLLVSGVADNKPLVARFNANGLLDTTFGGGDGWVSVTGSFISNLKPRLVVNSDGSSLIDVGINDSITGSPALLRFTADGALDTSFGASGVFKFSAPGGGGAYLEDFGVDSIGRLVVVGQASGDVVAMRFNTAATTPHVEASLNAGTLSVTGTDGSDAVTIRNDFTGHLLVETATQSFSFAFSAVSSIDVDLGDGADALTVRQVVAKPMTVAGGSGNDVLDVETSNGNDEDATLTATNIGGGSNDVTFDASIEQVQMHTLAGFDDIAIDLSAATTGSFIVDGGSGNDTYNLLAGVGSGVTLSLSDSGGTDTLDVSPVASTAIVSSRRRSVTFTDSTGLVTLSNFETITGLNGPRVTATAADYETAQSVSIAFQNLDTSSLDLSDLVIRNLNTGAFFTSGLLNAGDNLVAQGARWENFTTIGSTTPITLPDGNYRATIPIGKITDVLGNTNTSAISVDFFVLAGDANHDRTVNFADLVLLAQNYNQTMRTFSQGNFNYSTDGKVDFADLVLLAQRYNTSVAQPASLALTTKASASKKPSIASTII